MRALNDSIVDVKGLMWGAPPGEQFDLIFLCDLVFNHNEHENLLKTIKLAMHDNT